MTSAMSTVVSALIPALMGGVVVALLNYFLSREKSRAEIDKIRAETDKIYAEVKGLSATVSYVASDLPEQVIFDGRKGVDGFAIEGKGGQLWSASGKPVSARGEGELIFESNCILNVKRTNITGRFELHIRQYTYNGKQRSEIPRNDLITGNRKLRVTCEAKVVGGTHVLRFVVRNPVTFQRLAEDARKITVNQWTPIQIYLQPSATEDSQVRIDDEQVSAAPSSVQIRNLLIAERTD